MKAIRMRVLHIDTGMEMRGGQWQVLYLLQGLAQRGIDSRLLAPASSPLLTAALQSGCDARPLRPPLMRRFDLVHAHDARGHTLALLADDPVVVSRRVAFPLKRSPLSRYKYLRPAHFLAVSRYVRQVLLQAGVPDSKISVVYDGVHLPEHAPGNDRSRVIAIDSNDSGKGKAIVEGASRLSGIPVHFSNALAHDLPHASLFVYITELEGLGSAALLAMAHGVPVLASRVGGLPEIVERLTSNEPAAVARQMHELTTDRELAGRLGQRGRALVKQRFTVDHMVENTLAIYRQVLSC